MKLKSLEFSGTIEFMTTLDLPLLGGMEISISFDERQRYFVEEIYRHPDEMGLRIVDPIGPEGLILLGAETQFERDLIENCQVLYFENKETSYVYLIPNKMIGTTRNLQLLIHPNLRQL